MGVFDNPRKLENTKIVDACMLTWIYGKILADPDGGLNQQMLAPRFAMPEDLLKLKESPDDLVFATPDIWLSMHAQEFKDGEHILIPVYRSFDENGFPQPSERERHNKVVALPPKEFAKWRRSPGRGEALLWMPCSTVAEWLLELEQNTGHTAQRVLKTDPQALALVKARRAYLAELGRADNRVVFTFDRSFLGMSSFL